MAKLGDVVRSFLLWSGIALLACVYAAVGIVTTLLALPFDRRRRVAALWPNLWARSVVALNWRAEVDASRLPPGRHFVICSNHQSLGDIIINLHLRHNFKFIAKKSVFYVPALGWYIWAAGHIPLVRGRRTSILDAMEHAKSWLRRGVSVLFYPEGTRSPDGEVQPFKLGAFRLAIDAGVDVLPVLVTGGADLLPKNSFFFSRKKTPLRLAVGDPIPVAGLRPEDAQALAERTREVIIAMKRRAEGHDAREARAA